MEKTDEKIVLRQLEMFNMVFQDLWKEYIAPNPQRAKDYFYVFCKDKISKRIFELNIKIHIEK